MYVLFIFQCNHKPNSCLSVIQNAQLNLLISPVITWLQQENVLSPVQMTVKLCGLNNKQTKCRVRQTQGFWLRAQLYYEPKSVQDVRLTCALFKFLPWKVCCYAFPATGGDSVTPRLQHRCK